MVYTSDGLNKYDGYTFTIYHHDPDDTTSIASDDLTCIFEDSNGRLWVGTRRDGIDLFDQENNLFIHVRHTTLNSLRSNNILGITEDKAGALWVRTKEGIDRLEIVNGKSPGRPVNNNSFLNSTVLFTHIKLDSAFEAVKSKYGPAKVFVDSWNDILLTTNNKIWEIDFNDTRHSYRLLQRFTFTVIDSSLIPDILEDTVHHSLFLNNREVIKFPNYDFSSSEKIYSYEPFQVPCTIDKSERLWFRDSNRIIRIHLESGKIENAVPTEPSQIQAVNTITFLYIDRTGVLWIATGGYGILKYDPEIERFHHIVPELITYQLIESAPGEIITNNFKTITIKKNQPVSVNTLIDPLLQKKNSRK